MLPCLDRFWQGFLRFKWLHIGTLVCGNILLPSPVF
jgi:hypothetical protein